MNYLKLITQFWQLRRSKRITSLQADLYYYLIQECNERGWENPFQCSNKLICASIPISEPSLIDARNRLQQLGLIEFENGKRNEFSPVYELFYLKGNLNNLSRNRTGSLVEPLDEAEMKGEQYIDKHKLKLNKTKLSSFSGERSPEPNYKNSNSPLNTKEEKKKSSAKKRKEETNPLWKPFIACFDEWYKERYGNAYIFRGVDMKCMKEIFGFLKQRAELKKAAFTEENLLAAFSYFLQKAWNKDEWIRNNFSLSNLLLQFNQIVNSHGNSKTKQQTGGNVSTGSILSKIAAMPD